jgi:hypothetical protein
MRPRAIKSIASFPLRTGGHVATDSFKQTSSFRKQAAAKSLLTGYSMCTINAEPKIDLSYTCWSTLKTSLRAEAAKFRACFWDGQNQARKMSHLRQLPSRAVKMRSSCSHQEA